MILYSKKCPGKLALVKGFEVDYWYEGSGNYTNLNVLTSVSKQGLTSLTLEAVCKVNQLNPDQIYLAWEDSEWSLHGAAVAHYNVTLDDFCSPPSDSITLHFPGQS